MSAYDPEIIQQFADRLYRRAAGVIFVSTVLGVLIGFVGAPFILQALPASISLSVPEWAVAAALGIVGLMQGLERASTLKLQAQTALCQLQIERNTRGAKEPVT